MPIDPEDYLDEILGQIKKDSKELIASQEVSEDYFGTTSPSPVKAELGSQSKETAHNQANESGKENKAENTTYSIPEDKTSISPYFSHSDKDNKGNNPNQDSNSPGNPDTSDIKDSNNPSAQSISTGSTGLWPFNRNDNQSSPAPSTGNESSSSNGLPSLFNPSSSTSSSASLNGDGLNLDNLGSDSDNSNEEAEQAPNGISPAESFATLSPLSNNQSSSLLSGQSPSLQSGQTNSQTEYPLNGSTDSSSSNSLDGSNDSSGLDDSTGSFDSHADLPLGIPKYLTEALDGSQTVRSSNDGQDNENSMNGKTGSNEDSDFENSKGSIVPSPVSTSSFALSFPSPSNSNEPSASPASLSAVSLAPDQQDQESKGKDDQTIDDKSSKGKTSKQEQSPLVSDSGYSNTGKAKADPLFNSEHSSPIGLTDLSANLSAERSAESAERSAESAEKSADSSNLSAETPPESAEKSADTRLLATNSFSSHQLDSTDSSSPNGLANLNAGSSNSNSGNSDSGNTEAENDAPAGQAGTFDDLFNFFSSHAVPAQEPSIPSSASSSSKGDAVPGMESSTDSNPVSGASKIEAKTSTNGDAKAVGIVENPETKASSPDKDMSKHAEDNDQADPASSFNKSVKHLYPPLEESAFNLGEYDTRGFKQQHQRFDETFVSDEDISFYRKGVRHEFFLELDNRTETNGAIVDKIVNYVNYARNNPEDEIFMEVAYADGSIPTKKYGKYSPIPKKISNFVSRFLESSIADPETGEMYYIPTLLQHTPNLRVSISEVSESHQDPADFLNDKCYLLDALSTVHRYVDYINSQSDYDWDCTFEESPEFTYLKNKILNDLGIQAESANGSPLNADTLIPRDAGSGSFYKRSNRYLKGIWKAIDANLVSSYLPHIGTITYSHRLDFKTYKQNIIFGIEHDLDTAVQVFVESASAKKQKGMAAPLVVFPTRERPLYALSSSNLAKAFYWPAVWQPGLPLLIQPVFSLDTDKRLRNDLRQIMEQYKTSIYRYFLTGGLNKSNLKNGKKYEQDYLPSFSPHSGYLRLGDLLSTSKDEKSLKFRPEFAKKSVLTNEENSNSRSRSYEELRLLAEQAGDADSFISQLKIEEVPISVYKALLSRWPESFFSPELITSRDFIEYDIYTPPRDAEHDSIAEHIYYPNSALPFARIKPFE